jgi:uncharacterized membrane protein HdeD (DUF308 family)
VVRHHAGATGIAQIAVGVRRRSAELGQQWPMLLAGGLSVLAGTYWNVLTLADDPMLNVLVHYTAADGIFYIIQSFLIARRTRTGAPTERAGAATST